MEKKVTGQNPEEKANFCSTLFFTYTWDIFKKGHNNFWTKTNLYDPLDSHRSSRLGDKIERLWCQYSERCETVEKKPAVQKVLFRMFWPDLLKDSLLLILSLGPRSVQPILLGHILSALNNAAKNTKYEIYQYIFFFIIVNGITTIFSVQYKFSCSTTAMKVRIACGTLLFRKVLRMRISELQGKKKADTLNVISNELSRFDQTSHYVHYIWASPLFVLCIIYLLYYDAGVPGLIGVLWYILYMFLQSHAAHTTGTYRNKIAVETAKRIKLMNEILAVISFVKMYAWEEPFCKMVRVSRTCELDIIRKVSYLKGIFYALLSFANTMAIFFGMVTMILLKENLTVAKVFNLVLYYNTFNFVITLIFPFSIIKVTELNQILKRVNKMMYSEEIRETGNRAENIAKTEIIMKNVDVWWNTPSVCKLSNSVLSEKKVAEGLLLQEKKPEMVLKNINIMLKENTFLGIIGPVGCGKSSFLLTILGETYVYGHLTVIGSISYAPQEPWIFPGTVRQNIMFDQSFNEARYSEVIRVCGLNADFRNFPENDFTIIGEHGTSLSGGQRARISLARAVYKEADIYLLDDPLSSVDIAVGKYLLDHCINGLLNKKCRILVTHHIGHLQLCDRIIKLNLGKIEIEGAFKNLRSDKNVFSEDVSDSKTSSSLLSDTKLVDKLIENKSRVANNQYSSPHLNSTYDKKVKSPLWKYVTSGNNLCLILFVMILFVITQLVETFIYLFVSFWSYSEESSENTVYLQRQTYVYIFIILIITLIITSISKAILYTYLVMRSSRKIHDHILHKIINSQMSFFHVIDSGQILTRFSKDMGTVDEILPRTLMESFVVMLGLCARILLIIFINHYVIFLTIPLSVILTYFTKIFVCTSKNIKRIEGSLMEPVMTHINATIQGLSTIRASKAEDKIKNEFYSHYDRYMSSCYMFYTVTNAFSFAVEFISFIFTSVVTLGCFLMKDETGSNSGEIGLAITQSLAFTTYLQFCIIQCVQTNNHLVAIERILQYDDIPQEPDNSSEREILEEWPEKGIIHFECVELRYQEYLPAALHNLTFTIESNEKIGIIGRTGAGKSSIFAALLRTAHVSGQIKIDSYDTQDLPLDILRSRLGVIPQDPVLFSGTLRYNLDPFQEFDDNTLYAALKDVNLFKLSTSLKTLDDKILEGGSNLSMGQRQLVCLARTIIRKNKIILLDEATANVDLMTESFIQKTIATKFADCTVLTIAHRLSTVMQSDRIMIIDCGRIIHFDQPKKLIQNMHIELMS